MSLQRVAIVYDNSLRPETTGFYCHEALKSLVEVEHILPNELNQIPAEEFDLFLQIDDGLDYTLPQHLKPSAVWVIDTHMDFESAFRKAQTVDVVFAAQKDGAVALRERGVKGIWLPLACDPDWHVPQEICKQYDVCFVGHLFPGPRSELVQSIQHRYPRSFVGKCFFEEMARIYSASKIVFNRSLKNDLNMRVFEALACGSVLLTNALSGNGQEELFRDGRHCVMYRDESELFEKIDWLLSNDAAREQIAQAGREEVLAKHTYRHRMQKILDTVTRRIYTNRKTVSHPNSSAPSTGKDDRFTKTPNPTEPELTQTSESSRTTKSLGYFQHVRPELLERIPESSRRVLDVGCGVGALGAALKQRQPCEVWGIERDPDIAREAESRLDRVLTGDAEQIGDQLDSESFDIIVCGDVLEHLRDPLTFLRTARRCLEEQGRLVASLPNVRHHTVIRSLLDGNWTYEPTGLLDDDHVRFFTRREIEKLFFRAGFQIETLSVVPGSGHEEWVRQGRPLNVQIGGLSYKARDLEDAEELLAYQYLIQAVPVPERNDRLTSIVIVTHNQLPCTLDCVESIRHLTDEPYELIFVDNASQDSTPEFLESIPNATVIRNDDNRGFPAAVNQGLQVARGEQILLLNNDTIVTTGWLRRMLDALHREPEIGLVGPLSNNVSGEQQIPAHYDDLSALDGFAWSVGQTNQKQFTKTDRLVGFCLLIKREVIEQIGGMDERFGIGNFEDDDFCRRALEAGFQAVIARDAFVHHVGGATFRNSDVSFTELMEENQRKYDEKWNRNTGNQERDVEHQPPSENQDQPRGLLLSEFSLPTTNQPGVSLCMIVRDNERTIRAALESIRPYVDEMIVVDTGSTDRTPEICRELGARVEFFDWCDDFSAARNESLKYATSEWIFWMDSDDVISERCGQQLRALVDGDHPAERMGYVMQVHCPSANDSADVTIVDHVKLFRNRPELRFEHRIHEQIIPAIRRMGGEVAFTDIHVVHAGSDQTPEGRKRKLERDYRILKLDLEERPDHPFVLFNLGMTYEDDHQPEQAIRYLTRCLTVSDPQESHVRKAYALLVSSLCGANRHNDAFVSCSRALELFPDDPELLFRTAMLHQHAGRLAEAESVYRQILRGTSERCFASIDAGIVGFKTRHNLALVYQEMGRDQDAEAEWRTILTERPHYRPAWMGLGELLIKRGETDALDALLNDLALQPQLQVVHSLLQSRRAEQQGETDRALALLKTEWMRSPDDLELLQGLCRLSFMYGDPGETQSYLERLIEQNPDDGAAWHNLGTLHIKQRQFEDAEAAFRESLRCRPDTPQTVLHLSRILRASGRVSEAEQSLEQALEKHPGHPLLFDALHQLRTPEVTSIS